MAKPTWFLPYEGQNTVKIHAQYIAKTTTYIEAVKRNGLGFPADPSRPNQIYWKQVSRESGVKLASLVRVRSQCRKLILDAHAEGLQIRTRIKPRVRPAYPIKEAINIAEAVIQADGESAREKHHAKCKQARDLMHKIAGGCKPALRDDAVKAISRALEQQTFSKTETAVLKQIKEILLRASRGELELHTFHGRLKLESALAGFSLGAVAKFTDAATGTVIQWGAGVKAPTLSFKEEIPKIEKALRLSEGYLSKVHVSNRSGQSNVKLRHLPPEILEMPEEQRRLFRRLIDQNINLDKLTDDERANLMARTLQIFQADRDNADFRRSRLRLTEMQYGLSELADHVQKEFEDLAKMRMNVSVRSGIPSRRRGWDQNTATIYHGRFRLFLGWLHNQMGVAQDHLSIAYLAFDQVLLEYDLYLLGRRSKVGLKRKIVSASRERYVFAASLTRDRLGPRSLSGRRHRDNEVGWLRTRPDLLAKVKPIETPRVADQDNLEGNHGEVRPILTKLEIRRAEQNWRQRLDETTEEYRYQVALLAGEAAPPDAAARIDSILRRPQPLVAIEHGVVELRKRTLSLKPGSPHWCTAIREAVSLKFHTQIPLRRMTFCGLTYNQDNNGMVYRDGNEWWVKIPADIFKNEKSHAFEEMTKKGYFEARLEDVWGLYEDLELYVNFAREKILESVNSPAFFVTAKNKGHVTTGTFAGIFRRLTLEYIAENAGRGTGLKGVRSFGSQAMRHIVATATYKETKNLSAAALAIHDSENITQKHYKKYFIDTEERGAQIRATTQNRNGPSAWSALVEAVPRIVAPQVLGAAANGDTRSEMDEL